MCRVMFVFGLVFISCLKSSILEFEGTYILCIILADHNRFNIWLEIFHLQD